MEGQWLANIEGEYGASVRLEIERRGDVLMGSAYLFYDLDHNLPGFLFPIRAAVAAPVSFNTSTVYLHPAGGQMTNAERRGTEQFLTDKFGELPIPASLDVTLTLDDGDLIVTWRGDDRDGVERLFPSTIDGPSELISRPDLTSWADFRQWAVQQQPRHYIFRGQSNPRKLATTFHRTWRNDLAAWVADDVRTLFGSIMEKLTYPLQLGNLEHNAAVWSLLQHHGYPTPLLDWTHSPFVAAYFAFQNAARDAGAAPRIYIFDKKAWEEKHGRQAFFADAAPPQLVAMESIAVGNPRYGPQQALATVANVADIEGFIRSKEEEDGRTYLTVCDLPITEAAQVLRELELMGVTYGSFVDYR